LEKNSLIGHCTHTVESANVKVQNIFHGRNNITSSTNCKYRTAATLYVYPRNMVCFSYIIISAIHECNNKDDDDDDDNNNNNNNNNRS
jgi:hypothetical protein